MKRRLSLLILVLATGLGFSSCADEAEKVAPGPVSDTSKIPWNSPVAGQGQGQFGALPQNQYRR
jgi:hypothetical protein